MTGVLRIVPPDALDGLPSRAMGTKVLMPDGTEVPRVYRIELEADVHSGLWRAQIHCYAKMERVAAGATVFRVVPDGYVDVTRDGDPEERYARGADIAAPQPSPCECTTYCRHGKITQVPRRPGTYCRERATPLPPDPPEPPKRPPKRPPERVVTMGRVWPHCPSCGSTMMRKRWLFFGERPGCIQPECENYGLR